MKYHHFKSTIIALTVFLFGAAGNTFAQQTNLPFHHSFYRIVESQLYAPGTGFYTNMKPYRISDINTVTNVDSLLEPDYYKGKFFNTKVGRHFFKENLITKCGEDFSFTGDMLLNLEVGKDIANNAKTYTNTRGFLITGNIGKTLSFSTSFFENQARYLDYINQFAIKTKVIPGQGMYKKFKTDAYDFAMANGYISYTPSNHFNFQFGHDKNFIGDGYRSLLLSDNSFNYPFLKVTTTFWKLRYVNLFTSFQDPRIRYTYEAGFAKKYGSYHYLSFNAHKRLQIGLFEGIIWQVQDSTGNNGINLNYLNPVIFARSIQFSLGAPNNAIIGINSRFTLFKKTILYNQIVIDDINFRKMSGDKGFFQNKTGFQFGLKCYDMFGLKNLFFQTEYNQARPYTYSNTLAAQNYSHYNQALAHPLGANFRESVTFLAYRYKFMMIELKFNYAVYGADTSGLSFGGDIFRTNGDAANGITSFGNSIGQGLKTTLTYQDIRLVYIVNRRRNLNIMLGVINRNESSRINSHNNRFVYFGVRSSISNFYFDF